MFTITNKQLRKRCLTFNKPFSEYIDGIKASVMPRSDTFYFMPLVKYVYGPRLLLVCRDEYFTKEYENNFMHTSSLTTFKLNPERFMVLNL